MTTDLADVLAWVLIHSLWQGLVIAGMVLILLRSLPARCANARYGVALSGLLAVVLTMLATGSTLALESNRQASIQADHMEAQLAYDDPPPSAARQLSVHDPSVHPAAAGSFATSVAPDVRPHWSRRWVNWLLMSWLLGVGVMILRTAAAIVQVRSWRQSALPASREHLAPLEALLQELYGRLGFRRMVSLIVSDRVTVPSIIGALWPCILVPSAMLTGIPPDQWRIILAHELAHIRRYDVLVNLVQMLIESVLFFNPAVWWLSHQIRIEREACCDALAAKVCGESLTVARTLVEFAASLEETQAGEEVQRARNPSAVLASFADPNEPGTLTDRVHRLVQPDVAAYPRVSWWGLLLAMGSLGLTSIGLGWGTNAVVKTAAQLMSPKQRVAELERLQNEATGQYFPPEPKPASPPAPAQNEVKAGPEVPLSGAPKFSVTVIVRTADGSAVPREMYLMSHSRLGYSGATSTLGGNDRGQPVFRETYQFGPGFLRIGMKCPGYAEAASSILDLRSGPKSRTVEFILDRGATVKLSIRDEAGAPIPNALFGATAFLGIDGGGGGWPRENMRTDEQGLVTLTNVGSLGYTIRVRARGFQAVELKEFKPVETATISLSRAGAVQFNVVDGRSDRPLAGARFTMLGKSRKGSSRSYGANPRDYQFFDSWSAYAETDALGNLVIDELEPETQYVFAVRVPDFGITVVPGVRAGDPARTIKIFPPVKLAGRITGNLDQLIEQRGNPAAKPQRLLKYSSSFWEGSSDSSKRAVVDDEGRFEITDRIIDEKITFALPNREDRRLTFPNDFTESNLFHLAIAQVQDFTADTFFSQADLVA